MLHAIAQAQGRVWLESYIFEPDALGTRMLEALRAASLRGAEVRLLLDAFGSTPFGERHAAHLIEAGARVAFFNPLWAWQRRHPLHTRDHRKILVTETTAFTGGMNVSQDYAGPRLGNHRFRDTHAELTGPCVADLGALFLRSWRDATGERISPPQAPPPHADGVLVQVLGSHARRRREIQRALRAAVRRATQRCYLTSPYFMPPAFLQRALKSAARRGVDVRVLVAGESDVPLARHAAHHVVSGLLRAGVRVFEYFGRTLHAKTAVIDGAYAQVGSFNLDSWSHERNLEVSVALIDPLRVAEIEAHFHHDLSSSRELLLSSLQSRGPGRRLLDAAAAFVMRL